MANNTLKKSWCSDDKNTRRERCIGKKVTSEAILLKTILKRTGLHNHTLITRKAIIGLTDWCTEHLRLKKKKTKKTRPMWPRFSPTTIANIFPNFKCIVSSREISIILKLKGHIKRPLISRISN